MGPKPVSLSHEAYAALVAACLPGESFSDAVLRLVRGRSLTELSGAMPGEGAEAVARAIDATREDRVSRGG